MRRSLGVIGNMFLVGVLSVPALAFAQLPQETGLASTGGAAGIQSSLSIGQFIGTYFIQPILGLVGLIVFVFTVYAGVLWMTAAGEGKQIDKAKDILKSVVIGAALLMAAYTVSTAVINALTTGSVTGNVQPAGVQVAP